MPSLAELLKGKKFATPFLKEHYVAQQMAALPVEEGGLGLSAMNTPEERAAGMAKYVFPYMHGTERLDRFLAKKSLDPKRATSGPMPFGTDATEIASNYAMSKPDTSRIATDEGSMADYFQVSPKSLGYRGTSPYSVEQSYYSLPEEKRKELLENYYRVGYENPEEATGKFVLHPPGSDGSIASREHLDYLLKREGKGNPLSALRSLWGESGELYDNPEALADIYKTAGYPHEISQENAPWYSAKGVFKGNVLADNPIFTSNTEGLQKIIPDLEQAFAKDKTRTRSYGVDMWDKNTRYTPKEWVSQLKQDLESGQNSFVWTSIPDKVTQQLKRLGYDAIVDEGGKMGGQGHQVVIPFEPHQVRASTAAFNPAKKYEANLLASHPIANAIGLTGLARILSQGQDVDLRGSINDYLSEGYDPAGLERLTGVAPTTRKGDIALETLGALPGPIGTMATGASLVDMAENADWKKIKKSISSMFR